MIPMADIIPGNLYSQDDATFLLGEGFSKRGAREAITEACRSGALPARLWRRRYWFRGADFLEWVRLWFGSSELRALASRRDKPHNPTRRTGSALGKDSQ